MIRTISSLLPVLVLAGASSVQGEEVGDGPPLSPRNAEVAFCYLRGSTRTWPIVRRPLSKGESLALTVRQSRSASKDGPAEPALGEGASVTTGGVVIAVTGEGKLSVDAGALANDAPSPAWDVELRVVRDGTTKSTQRVVVRPAPPARPISYIADLVDDLIRIFAEPAQGRFQPVTKDAFDQYFRRVQAHGTTRLVVWHSPFPYFTRPEDHEPEHWRSYERQARAILECEELNRSLRNTKDLPSWLWLQFVMRLRLEPDAGRMFAQSAAEHGIALSASFRPFESALTKYYEVPAFDADGNFLHGFLPLAAPVVNYRPEDCCFGHYRIVLDRMGRADAGKLATIELPGLSAADAKALTEKHGPTGGFVVRASRFPPLDVDGFVLSRQADGSFRLVRYREIQAKAEATRRTVAGVVLEQVDGVARLRCGDVAADQRFLVLTHPPSNDGAAAKDAPQVTLDRETPIRLRAAAGNRLDRETIYWLLDEATPEGRATRVAAITTEGQFRSLFDACTGSINRMLDRPARVPLSRAGIVIDRGDLWSVEMLDFQQPAARRMAVAQLKTLFDLSKSGSRGPNSGVSTKPDVGKDNAANGVSTTRRPFGGYDEIFLSTRSHVDLAPTVADGEDGQRTLAHYYRTKRSYLHHLGLDKAYAPRSVASNARLRDAAASNGSGSRQTSSPSDSGGRQTSSSGKTPPSVERITTWQDAEWRDPCQADDSPFVWRLARNQAVADGVGQLLRDLEREFPGVRIRVVIPPRETMIRRLQDQLDELPTATGGKYGRGYYRHLWCSNNHIPTIGEGMAMVDLRETRVEPVFLGSGAYQPDAAPFDLFVREQIVDLKENRGSSFHGPRSYFYEGQFTLRATDQADARRHRERTIRHLLAQKNDIGEVLLYEAADWLYFFPLSDPDLCGHGFLDRAGER